MLTVNDIIDIAKKSQFLSTVSIKQSGLFGGGIDLQLPRKLYCIRKNVEWLNTLDSDDLSLTETSNYLYALCGRFGLLAQGIGGGGGSISPVGGKAIYPFIITSADFQSDGITYLNPDIVGDSLMIFINEWSQQWLTSPDSFIYVAGGIQIVLLGFDANTASYTIVIQKRNNG